MAIRTFYSHGQFAWIDLVARDMAEARDFYKRYFGWDSVDVDTQGGPPYAYFQLEGKSVAGIGQMGQEMLNRRLPAMWNSYINVDDIDTVCAKVTELGGKILVPVRKVSDAGSLAFIQDPTGAQVGLWQKDQHFGAEIQQDFHSCCWNELCTRDIEKARDFFEQLFGWEFSEYPTAMAKYYVVKNRGEENSGLMQIDERWGEMPPCWMVYFAVHSVDMAVDQLRQLGGYVLVHPFDIAEGRLAVVADGQGAAFNLVEMIDPPGE